MKNKLFFFVLFLAIAGVLMVSCTGKPAVTISDNPYDDDYSEITPLSKRHLWGAANVHDPAIIKTDSFYYVYSTDAYYRKYGVEFVDDDTKMGNIPVRRSKDLINWEFVGWVLDSIPTEAIRHIHSFTDNKGADNMWAPYVVKYENVYRIYYSVSSFGTNSSYIGMAESPTPEGPWTDKGCVVKTDPSSKMNAIDASVISDVENGRMWMHYGSYFGGLYCMELLPETGLAKTEGDQGHLVATRAEKEERIIEAPEIIYNPELNKYFLFVSYEPLLTYYNLRVGRSDYPQGPFFDYFGNDMADTTNNFPILTHSYMFENHPGWSGNAHCAVINDKGRYFMLHQGRLAPDNLMMVMHVREMKWLPSGWPVVSPQRYVGDFDQNVKVKELAGEWEIIVLDDLPDQTKLWQGQIPYGGWTYGKSAFNLSERVVLNADGTVNWKNADNWQYKDGILLLGQNSCAIFRGWDWENKTPAVLFSGILPDGTGVWGKKVTSTRN